MCIPNAMDLTLNGDTFKSLKEDFNSILKRTIGNMTMKGASDATVTLKLSISLEKVSDTSEEGCREVTKPSFKHDISSMMQVKDKKSGALTGNNELVWDEEKGDWVLREFGAKQMNMFDENDNTYYAADYAEVDDSREPLLLGTGDPLERFLNFVGEHLEVLVARDEDGALMDAYVRIVVEDGEEQFVMITSECKIDEPCFCPADVIAKHEGHDLECVAFYDEEDIPQFVELRCKTCGDLVFRYPEDDDKEVPDSNIQNDNGKVDADDGDIVERLRNMVNAPVEETPEDGGMEYEGPDEPIPMF